MELSCLHMIIYDPNRCITYINIHFILLSINNYHFCTYVWCKLCTESYLYITIQIFFVTIKLHPKLFSIPFLNECHCKLNMSVYIRVHQFCTPARYLQIYRKFVAKLPYCFCPMVYIGKLLCENPNHITD